MFLNPLTNHKVLAGIAAASCVAALLAIVALVVKPSRGEVALRARQGSGSDSGDLKIDLQASRDGTKQSFLAGATATPLPEQAARGISLPAAPVPTLPSSLATPRVRSDADADTGVSPVTGASSGVTSAPAAGKIAMPTASTNDASSTDEIFNRAVAIYASRAAAAQTPPPPIDLPIGSGPADALNKATPAPVLVPESGTVAANNSEVLRNLPKGYLVGKTSIQPIRDTNLNASDSPFEYSDISGRGGDVPTTRVEQLLRKYKGTDLPPALATPPPIAVPEDLRPSVFTPVPTRPVRERVHNIPTQLRQPLLPTQSNMYSAPDDDKKKASAGAPGPGNFDFPSDAGTVPFSLAPALDASNSVSIPGERTGPPMADPSAAAVPQAAQAKAESGQPNNYSAPTGFASPQESPAASPVDGVPLPDAKGQYTIKRGKAEVTFGNVPPGGIRALPPEAGTPAAETTPDVKAALDKLNAYGAVPKPPIVGTTAARPTQNAVNRPTPSAQEMMALSNAPSVPSPTPNYDADGRVPVTGTPPGKWALPPAPTLPARGVHPEPKGTRTPVAGIGNDSVETQGVDGLPDKNATAIAGLPTLAEGNPAAAAQHTPLDKSALLNLAGSGGASPAASVGSKVLTDRAASRRVDAMLALEGKSVDPSKRKALERVMAEEWAERTAIAEEARRQKVEISDAEVQDFIERQKQRVGSNLLDALKSAGYSDIEIQDEMHDSALSEKLVEIVYKKGIDDAKLRAVYDQNPAQFQPSRRLHVLQIFKAKPADAASARATMNQMQSLQKQIAGSGDFASAAQSGDGPEHQKGGDLGWLDSKSNITEEMAGALDKLKPGQLSGVVAGPDGYRILKLVEVQEPKPGFEGARDIVEAGIRAFLRRSAYDTAKQHFVVMIGTRQDKPVNAPAPNAKIASQGAGRGKTGLQPAQNGGDSASSFDSSAPQGFGGAAASSSVQNGNKAASNYGRAGVRNVPSSSRRYR